MTTVLIILIAVFTDALLGEPARWHPIAGFGKFAGKIESLFNRHSFSQAASSKSYIAGIVAWLLLVCPFVFAAWLLASVNNVFYWIVSVALLYLSIGNYSLVQHAQAVLSALEKDDLQHARERVAFMVSRDTQNMTKNEISSATIESVLENGCDAIFGAIFWFIVLGVPGVVLYRLANTLDAMWGYRTTRYSYFGWASARIDDLLNWLPAQLTALGYAIMGNTILSTRAWFTQAKLWKSINAGSVMASGAGALNLQLGGAATYEGKVERRIQLGFGQPPQQQDIKRSIRLVQRSLWLWLVVIFLGGALVHGTWW